MCVAQLRHLDEIERQHSSHSACVCMYVCVCLCVCAGKSLARDKSPGVLGMMTEGGRELALSRDVGRKMASQNNDAYIYEIYA